MLGELLLYTRARAWDGAATPPRSGFANRGVLSGWLLHDHGVGKKAGRPDNDEDKVLSKLRRAHERQLPVRIRRWFPDASPIEGFVVGVGKRWVAVALLPEGEEHDGYDLVRLEDIHKVRVEKDPEAIRARVLIARGQWPLPPPSVRLGNIKAVIRDVGSEGALFSVHVERHRPDAMWVGALRKIAGGQLHLAHLTPDAQWDEEPLRLDLHDITRVTIATSQLKDLTLAAPPRSNAVTGGT